MKKALAIILSVMMLMSTLVACGSKTDDNGDANNDAAASYPTKNVNVIVPFSAGGNTDMSMRALLNVATSLDSKYTFVVDNKTGNAGLIGMEALAEADPDGYTLGTTNIDLLLHICFGRTDVTMDNYIPIAATMADPYVLGISSGASLGATSAILLGVGAAFGSNSVGVMAFLGAFVVSLAVVGLANIGGRANSVKLLLAGTALSSVCSAFSNFIVYIAHDKEGIQTVTYWMMGALGGATWEIDGTVLLVVLAGIVFFLTQYRTLNLMLLGDETSITLGTDLHKWRQLYLLVCAAIVGFSVYAAGMIGFVGLVIPHVVRMLYGTDHKRLLPISALVGAIFLIWADVACRTILPGQELPIGILTSMIGAPCFIYLMARKRYGFGGGD